MLKTNLFKHAALMALVLPSTLLAGKSNPGAPLVSADDAFAKSAQRVGEWTAFRAVAVPQSEMFAPKRVKIIEFGLGLPNPPVATRWRAEQAWLSCDGTVGLTFGRWTLPGTGERGWYEALWGKLANGSWRILLRHAGTTERNLFSRPGRKGMRAACTGMPPPLPIVAPAVGTDFKLGASYDQTLIWSSAVSEKGEVRIVISLWDGARHVPVLEDVAAAPSPR